MVHVVHSFVFTRKGEWERALKSVNKAIDARPDAYALWNNKGTLLYRLKRSSESIAAYEKSIELNPQAPLAYAYLGFHYYEISDDVQTLKCFEHAAERRFPGYFPYMYLADQASRTGDGKRFCKMAIRMAECQDCPEAIQRDYGWELATSDDPNKRDGLGALEIAERLLEKNKVPPDSRARYLVLKAAALAELERIVEALETLETIRAGYRDQQWEQMKRVYQGKE